MFEENPNINVIGTDLKEEHLVYAKELVQQKGGQNQPVFKKGDMNKFEFDNNCFDFIWCCDGLWSGPAEMGCAAEEPYDILASMARITKSGGKIAVLFWSSQKLIPGYPLLEAALNSTLGANVPVTPESNPELHFMRTPLWLKKTGLTNIKVHIFTSDIQGPLSSQAKNDMHNLFNMFWARAENEVAAEVWKQYKELTNPDSSDYIFKQEDYVGFITYTMFTGEVHR